MAQLWGPFLDPTVRYFKLLWELLTFDFEIERNITSMCKWHRLVLINDHSLFYACAIKTDLEEQ